MRKLKPFLLALLFVPAAAYSLGLGDIRLHSGLHQPLSAEIDLLSVSPDDVSTIAVSLASHEAFQQLGIDRPVSLMALEFTVEQRPNGSYFVRATSQRPVSDPFLDFLLEVNWRSGRLLREYTVLLDPPELMQNEAPPAVRAPAVRAPGVRAPAAPREPAASTPAESEPAEGDAAASEPAAASVARSDPTAQPAPANGDAVAAPAKIPKRGVPVRNDARTYGPVKGNETLWSIANKMRPDSASVPQVMMALLKGNPQSFEGKNVNRLKAGTVLRLDPAMLKAMSQADAAREVARQDRQWQDFKQKAAGKATSRTPAGEAAVPRSAAAVKKSEPRLKLVAPEAAKPGKADASGTATDAAKALESLKKELLLAQEAGEAGKQENQELRKRVQELEGQIKSMERLLTLKDDDLAALQRKLAEEAAKPAAAPSQTVAPSAKGQSAQPAGQAKPLTVPTDTGPGTAAVPAPAALPEPFAPEIPATTPAPGAVEPTGATPAVPAPASNGAPQEAVPGTGTEPAAKPEAKKPAPKKKPVRPAPPPPPEPSFLDSLLASPLAAIPLLSNPIYAGGALLLVLALIALLVLFIRRRRNGGNFTESILMGGTPSMMKAKAAEGKASEESSFFSDFAVSGMGDIKAEDSEVDPLTEADVYMAYQRYQQAEDLVKDAIKHNPERPELHLKLLEVYHATQDKEKFEAEALKTHALVNGAGPVWKKVLAMGHGLAPEHPLFAKAPKASGAADHADARLDNEVLDIGLDLDALTEEMESGGGSGGGGGFIDLGVDFSDLEEQKPQKQAAPAAKPTPAPARAPVEEPSFDLDLDALVTQAEPAPAPSPRTAAAPAKSDLDFDLSGLSLEEPEAASGSATQGQSGSSLELEAFDLGSLDLVSAEAEPAGELNITDLEMSGQSGGDLLLGDINEVETKLDLARAYVDMGDGEGARNLLDEVLQEGDAAQKQQAQEILKKIA